MKYLREDKEKNKKDAGDALAGILGAATGVDFGALKEDTKKEKGEGI